MAVTRQIPRGEWKTYFERFTRRHLVDEGSAQKTATIEVLSPALGDQLEATFVGVIGMAYDARSNAFELALVNLDHLIFRPAEIWVIEEDDDFISALEVVDADGNKEIVQLRQSSPAALAPELPA